MRLLFDTHALLWWLADDSRLALPPRQLIDDPGNDVFVTVVSLWEIVVKVRVGKLRVEVKELINIVKREGFFLLDIAASHLATLESLPMHHRDPFDHLLIAQAIAEDATVISEDQNIRRYPVRYIPCSEFRAPRTT